MPLLDFFSRLANRNAPKPMGAPIYGPPQDATPIAPSWMRQGFEGGTDAMMGLLGQSMPTTANKVGQLVGSGLPMMSSLANPLKSIYGMASEAMNPAVTMGETLANPPATSMMKQGMKALSPQGQPILDDAGRFLGFAPPEDPVFAAHVASSRNKKTIVKPTIDEVRSRYGNLAPSADQVQAMMDKYKR